MVYAPAAQWDILKQDLRYTVRTLSRARGFALTAILVTGLGVGANTAAFSVADFVLSVGVVGDVRVRGLERTSEPQMYVPALQVPEGSASNIDPKDLVIRHAGQMDALVSAVRQIVREVDPEQPISDMRPMDEVLAGDTATRHAQLQVLGVLAAVAVLLAGVGIYGLLAYSSDRRRLGCVSRWARNPRAWAV
jgi:hypothetical protein